MRVALITPSYPPSDTGLGRATFEIALSLRSDGHEVCVFVSDRGENDDAETASELKGFAASAGTIGSFFRRIPILGAVIDGYAARRSVCAAHIERPFDVIEAWNWKFLGLFLVFFPIAPFVTRNATSIIDMKPSRISSVRDFLENLAIRLLFLIERASARASTVLISNSRTHWQRINTLYRLHGGARVHTVVLLSLPPIFAARSNFFSAPPDVAQLNLLFVGRATERKGFDALVAAAVILDAAATSGEINDFRLRLVGVSNGELAKQLENTSHHKSNVPIFRLECLSHIEDSELHRLYDAAHVVIAPSRYESFGLVYWEAMAFGRPIVACSEDPCAVDFVDAANAGVLARNCNGESLAAVIKGLLLDRQLRLRLGSNGSKAAQRLDRRSLAKGTLNAYNIAQARYQCRKS